MSIIEQLKDTYIGEITHMGGELGQYRTYLWVAPFFTTFIKVDLVNGQVSTLIEKTNEWLLDCWKVEIPAYIQ